MINIFHNTNTSCMLVEGIGWFYEPTVRQIQTFSQTLQTEPQFHTI